VPKSFCRVTPFVLWFYFCWTLQTFNIYGSPAKSYWIYFCSYYFDRCCGCWTGKLKSTNGSAAACSPAQTAHTDERIKRFRAAESMAGSPNGTGPNKRGTMQNGCRLNEWNCLKLHAKRKLKSSQNTRRKSAGTGRVESGATQMIHMENAKCKYWMRF